jgi:hypothetical protein
MTLYGTSTTFSFTTKKVCTKSRSGVRNREQKGLVTHPDSGPELQLYSKNLLTLKKNKGNESIFFSRIKRRIPTTHIRQLTRTHKQRQTLGAKAGRYIAIMETEKESVSFLFILKILWAASNIIIQSLQNLQEKALNTIIQSLQNSLTRKETQQTNLPQSCAASARLALLAAQGLELLLNG